MTSFLVRDAGTLDGGRRRDVAIVDGRITSTIPEDAELIHSGGWVIPGLVDAHSHLLASTRAVGTYVDTLSMSAASVERHISRVLAANRRHGIRAIRDVGDPSDGAVARHRARHHRIGVAFHAAGRFVNGGAMPVSDTELLDPTALLAQVREQAALGGGWVKIVADRYSAAGPPALTIRPDHLITMIETAHAAGARVAVHAVGRPAVRAALSAAADTLEHGTFVTPGDVAHMARQGTAWVPTVVAMRRTLSSRLTASEMRDAFRDLASNLRLAHEAGVAILTGSDGHLPAGAVGIEAVALSECGLEMAAAFDAAVDRACAVAVDLPGNVMVTECDPREDISTLLEPLLIVSSGRLIRPAIGRGSTVDAALAGLRLDLGTTGSS